MEEDLVRKLNYDKLIVCVNKISEVVSKTCDSFNEKESSTDRLILKHQLDKLMIEYLNLIKISNEIE
jgi:hypothetical protein